MPGSCHSEGNKHQIDNKSLDINAVDNDMQFLLYLLALHARQPVVKNALESSQTRMSGRKLHSSMQINNAQ